MDILPPSQSIPTAYQINEWLYNTIKPYLKGRVLEVESGFNTISSIFAKQGRRLHLSTPNRALREQLKAHYQGIEEIRKVHSINFHRPDFGSAYPVEKAGIFDTILVLNPIENGQIDYKMVENARYLLQERGYLILLTPVFTAFYGNENPDWVELERCDIPAVKRLLTSDMTILATQYFYLPEGSGYEKPGISVLTVSRKNKDT